MTTVQDLGRFGYARYGVAPSGVLDTVAARVANLLVDNPEGEACLEVTLTGLELGVLTEVAVAVTGGDLGVHVNGKAIQPWRSVRLAPGDLLAFSAMQRGCRAILAAGGGFDIPSVLESKSTSLSSGFGGLQGRALKAGDVLVGRDPDLHLHAAGRHFDDNLVPVYANDWQLRVLAGPQQHYFSATAIDLLHRSEYKVSQRSDRTGIRLQGPAVQILPEAPKSIVSEGVVAGAIQVPADGRPIIILNETVSGGYHKIAVVIAADLPLTAQMLPGDRVSLTPVSMWQARQALWQLEESIARLRNRL